MFKNNSIKKGVMKLFNQRIKEAQKAYDNEISSLKEGKIVAQHQAIAELDDKLEQIDLKHEYDKSSTLSTHISSIISPLQ